MRCGSGNLLLGACAGLSTIGVGGGCWFLAGAAVPDWWLLIAAAAAAAAAFAFRRPDGLAPPGDPSNAVLAPARLPAVVFPAIVFAAVVLGALVIGYGALATPSRHWDGAVMWDVKAAALTANPTLEQPWFRDGAIFCHSRDYPLLQPLTVALLERQALPGRLLFAAAFAMFVGAVYAAARTAGHSYPRVLALSLGAALTPMVLAPSSGGFDSGYGDGLLSAAVATIAYGLVGRSAWPIALGCTVAILQKPEGLPYCASLAAASFGAGDRRVLVPVVLSSAFAGAIGLSLRANLRTGADPRGLLTVVAGAVALAIVVLALDRWIARSHRPRRWRVAALGIAVLALLPLLPTTLWERLDRLPRLAGAIGGWAFGDRFALTFVVPCALAFANWRRGIAPRTGCLGLWLLAAVPIACLPFLIVPMPSDHLDEHTRATLPRLLLHWTGAAWIWTAANWPPGGTADDRA